MTLNLIKLCVGIDNIDNLAEWQKKKLQQRNAARQPAELWHRTRQMPRRRDELLDGGSIYWVIKGMILVRQKLRDFREVRCDDGIRRCDIILDPALVPTRPHPRRAFQGWRYLDANDAPRDLGLKDHELHSLPEEMRSELLELGLL